MHIPDGVIPLPQAIFYIIVSLTLVAIAIWQSRKTITSKQLIIVGVLGAGIFAAQMFNFPVPYGSSGHLIGTALATVLVGPWVAMLILTSILFIQSFFGDGGLLAIGANVLNMAVIGAFTTVLLFLLVPKRWRKNQYAFAGFSAAAAFLSTILMSLSASTELTIAQVGPPRLIFGWMVGLHAVIGLAEAAITFTVVSFVFVADPSLFHLAEDSLFMHSHKPTTTTEVPHYKFPIWGLVVTLII
jgi:cobalt/nickel transport system permease protein